MPRSSNKVFKKRRGNFNQGRRSNSESTVTSDSVPPQQFSPSNSNVSFQKKKLSNLNNSYKSEFNSGFKNAIGDLNILAGVFSEAVKCLQCGTTGLNLSCEENCSGGAVELDILCDFCSYSYKFCSSKQCKAEFGKPSTYEINNRPITLKVQKKWIMTSMELPLISGIVIDKKADSSRLLMIHVLSGF
ncbi:hypothetical protein TNCT_738831 [Trichonephila clavata]|uniref:Uncharacterized protein n=1 Tax=Trichonephila clavata TaxID=2740835 RepID=A0A8X6HPJ2_TRICU|nr:hypothetical protein TNCT_738831 [Trichonephila clavata]